MSALPPMPVLRTSEAVLAVADVAATIRFYREKLGFEGEWLWGDPPTFGGVRWGGIQIMFCQQERLASKVEGHMHYFRCDDIEALYQHHRQRHAPIIDDIENKPWDLREYTIRDINGYHLRFGGPPRYERPVTARQSLPADVTIAERIPTLAEYYTLAESVGWNRHESTASTALQNSLYGAVAMAGEEAVGMLRIIGDGGRFYYIQDVVVCPPRQNQRIGTALMEAAMAWLERTAPKGAWIGLFTPKPAFYERFGFKSGGGMCIWL